MKILRQKQLVQAAGLLFFTCCASHAAAAPVAYPDRLDTRMGEARTVGVLWNDKGHSLHVSHVNRYSKRGGRAYVVAGRKIHYTPKPGFTGTDTFWYEIKDGYGRTNSAKVTVYVKGHHQPRISHRKQPNYNIQWSQPGFSINYSKHGGVQAQFGSPQSHTHTYSGGQKHWSRGSGPVGHPDVFTTYAASGQVPLYVLDNDQGHHLKVLKTNPWTKHGGQAWVVNNHAGSFIMYTPKPGFYGTDELWYVLRDASGRTNSTKVIITVW